MPEKVAFIGVGLIGERMARRVLKAGYPLAVYDVRPAQLEGLVQEGAEAASSPKDAAARCPTILLSLPNSDIVEAVCLGKDGIIHGAQPGTIVVDLTSGDPPHTVKISDRLAEGGIKMIDVGVAGSFPQAEKGTLGVIAGGDIEVLEKVWPVLKSFSDRRYHLGKIGSGHFVKSLNNFLGAAYYVAACEAIIVAAKAGLDPNKVLEVLNEGGGRSTATENRIPAWLKRDFSRGMAVELLVKDVATTCGLGREHKTPMFIANTLHQLLMHAAAEIGYKEHNGAIAKAFEKWAEFEVRGS